jgi:hypothetical protein
LLASQVTRAFDALCTLAGVAVLVVLGPLALFTAVKNPPPRGDLLRLDGQVASCRERLMGTELQLRSSGLQVYSLVDYCSELRALPGRPLNVSVLVSSRQLARHVPGEALAGIGLVVNGTIVRSADIDKRVLRLDYAILLAISVPTTGGLLWLTWATARQRGGLRRLLTDGSAIFIQSSRNSR